MAFMDNYEGNKERTDRWIATYPEGRLETLIVEFNAEKTEERRRPLRGSNPQP